MRFFHLVLSCAATVRAQEPATAAQMTTITAEQTMATLKILEEVRAAREKRRAAADQREHEQQLELLALCGHGPLRGGRIAAQCDLAFAAAEAVREGRPVWFSQDGRAQTVSSGYGWGFPGLYAGIAYGGGLFDPQAELLRQILLTQGEQGRDIYALGLAFTPSNSR